MKNKVDISLAVKAAECLKLRLDTKDYRGFPHVADFAAGSPSGDGILACCDSPVSLSAEDLCREEEGAENKDIGQVSGNPCTAEETAAEYLARAEADDCGAYVTVMRDACLKHAREVDRRVAEGEYLPLAGVPLSVKDNICTAGTRTTCASRALADFVPDYDATVYSRLIAAGAIPVGKTNMDEFAIGSDGSTSYFGKCKNPLDRTRTPGGSSSGSAASLAADTAVISLGSDTGGSARIPASYCGLAALKPTYGSFSRFGLVGMAPSLEQICPMAKRVDDLIAVFRVASGRDPRDMTTLVSRKEHRNTGAAGIFLPSDATDSAVRAVKRSAEVLARSGYETREIRLPYYESILGIYYTVSSAEASSNLARYDGLRYGYVAESGELTDSRSENFGVRLRERLAEGAYVLNCEGGGAYAEALKLREELKKAFEDLFSKLDFIITPMSLTEAGEFGEDECSAERFAVYANLTGAPAVTVPAARGESGLPVGVQLIGDLWSDEELLCAAKRLEDELVW